MKAATGGSWGAGGSERASERGGGMNVYCSVLRLSPGKRDAQIHAHVTLISVSGDCKENKSNDNEIKENISGEVWRSARGKKGAEGRAFGRAEEGMNQPLLFVLSSHFSATAVNLVAFLNQ